MNVRQLLRSDAALDTVLASETAGHTADPVVGASFEGCPAEGYTRSSIRRELALIHGAGDAEESTPPVGVMVARRPDAMAEGTVRRYGTDDSLVKARKADEQRRENVALRDGMWHISNAMERKSREQSPSDADLPDTVWGVLRVYRSTRIREPISVTNTAIEYASDDRLSKMDIICTSHDVLEKPCVAAVARYLEKRASKQFRRTYGSSLLDWVLTHGAERRA